MSNGRPTDKDRLLTLVPEDGTPIGNVTLRSELGWNDDKYWRVRDELIVEDKLVLGKGKGGSVRRTRATVSVEDVVDDETLRSEAETTSHAAEEQLYAGIERVLSEKWSKEYRLEDFFVQQTAKQGRRDTGGKWTRPDLVIVSVRTFQNLPGKFVDVTTFEVKTHDNFDVTAVYEALAHVRASTRAYVFIGNIPESDDHDSRELDAVIVEANRHGIGLIVASDVSDFGKWKVLVEPQLNSPDLERLDEFLESQITDENTKKLRKWIK